MRPAFFVNFAAAVSIALMGCTEAQRESMTMRSQIIATAKEGKSCALAAYEAPRFAPLWLHMPIPPSAPTIDQLSDQGYPSPADAGLIKSLHDELAPCRARVLDQLDAIDGRIAAAFSDHFNAGDQILVDLVHRKITWEQANREIHFEQSSAKRRVLGIVATINGELRQQNQAELEARREATARLAQDFNSLAQGVATVAEVAREAHQASRPVVTTCNQILFNTTCVSQ